MWLKNRETILICRKLPSSSSSSSSSSFFSTMRLQTKIVSRWIPEIHFIRIEHWIRDFIRILIWKTTTEPAQHPKKHLKLQTNEKLWEQHAYCSVHKHIVRSETHVDTGRSPSPRNRPFVRKLLWPPDVASVRIASAIVYFSAPVGDILPLRMSPLCFAVRGAPCTWSPAESLLRDCA